MTQELIKRMKAAIEGECDGLAITDEHAKAILDYVLEGSSDADERAAFEEAAAIAEGFGPSRPIVAERPSDLIRGRWEGEQAASSNIAKLIRARAASTRTASDTRTAAGEAECDAALGRAAPAELDFLEEWLRFAAEPVGMECCGNGVVGGQYMGQSEMICCGNGEPVERGAEEVIAAMQARHNELTAELSKTAGPACQGGNTQPVSVESARPAEVDVEAERKLFLVDYRKRNSSVPDFLPDNQIMANRSISDEFDGWLAKARTQADAGRDAERYRYLRAADWSEIESIFWSHEVQSGNSPEECCVNLDREIDARIQSVSPTTKPENT